MWSGGCEESLELLSDQEMLIREAVRCPEEGLRLGKLEGFQGPPVLMSAKAESVILLLFLFSERECAVTASHG